MIILTIRSDKPLAEIGLYDNDKKVDYIVWEAHRQLAETIHIKFKDMLGINNIDWSGIQGIVCYQGPGSFTGLRIGISVANALAGSLGVPIVATNGEDWIKCGQSQVQSGEDQKVIVPEYGSLPHITAPRK